MNIIDLNIDDQFDESRINVEKNADLKVEKCSKTFNKHLNKNESTQTITSLKIDSRFFIEENKLS